MFILFLFWGVCLLVQVNTQALLHSVQAYPVTTFQQNVYRSPYSEAYIVPSSNINPYSQHISLQTPLPTYQALQVPSLTEQISKMYLDKLFSNPSLRSILDPNNIIQNQYAKDKQSNSYPYNTGGVVNNYIIIPTEYLKINDTVAKHQKKKRAKNEVKNSEQENVTAKHRRKKVLNNDQITNKDKDSPNTKKSQKRKQSEDTSSTFYTNNIKCFTPADILDSDQYKPQKKDKKNNEITKHCHNNKNPKSKKSNNNRENTEKVQTSRKTKKKKSKKKLNENVDHDEKSQENISLLSTTQKNKKPLEVCDCIKNEELDCEFNVKEDIPQYCEQDINDLLLSNLLQQGCTDLENRQTRNSKTDTGMKDFRNIYPDLSGDISKSFTWYMNDLFSPHSSSASSSNFLGNNMYPFDLTQIYQVPQYSDVDLNKSNGNIGQDQNSRRKKKKKNKNSRTKANKDVVTNSDGNENVQNSETNSQNLEANSVISEKNTQTLETNFQITDPSFTTQKTNFHIPLSNFQAPQINIQIPKTCTQIQEGNFQSPDIKILIPEIHISEKSSRAKPNEAVEVTSLVKQTTPIEMFSIPSKNLALESVDTKAINSFDKVLANIEEPVNETYTENNLKNGNQSRATTISQGVSEVTESVLTNTNKANDVIEKPPTSKMQPDVEFQDFDSFPVLESNDEMVNILLNDYYPDFRADNQAFLISEEEIDVRNIHDRYFYATDRNIDSKEVYSPEQNNPYFNEKVSYIEDNLESNKQFKYSCNKNLDTHEDKSKEINFRTPPGLEVPDFITRKINKDREDSSEIYYIHNNYEDDFNTFDVNSFDHKSNENEGSLVETIYARSKVVKYGSGRELHKPLQPEALSNISNLEDVTIENDGDKTVVIAKSLRSEDGDYKM